MKKNKKQSNIDFRFMSFFFKVRDVFHPPIEKIRKANIKQGDIVLDYGCGSGSYTIAAAEVIKPNGKVIAADIHPLALQKVSKKSEKSGYNNIETIQTDCATGLDNESIDVVICFDVIHDIPNKYNILKEFHRVLKHTSTLSFDDHHLKENEIIDFITSEGLFKLSEKNDKQFNFIKV
ncbi:MAG: class I SAM-dependent methyltransferase [Promethearchaeota archaeon]